MEDLQIDSRFRSRDLLAWIMFTAKRNMFPDSPLAVTAMRRGEERRLFCSSVLTRIANCAHAAAATAAPLLSVARDSARRKETLIGAHRS